MITAFGYDGIGRQNMLLHDMTGSGGTGDVTWTYGRNAASQIAGQTRTNDAYAWGGHYAVTRAYTTDGLNRYTTAGGASFTYDANGNLITTPGSHANETITYVYDIENRLVGAASSTGATPTVTLFYDPLGRLFSSTVSGVTTEFFYDGDALVGEYVGTNLIERYVHAVGADVPVLWYHGSPLTDRRWLHADHQGSIVATSNGLGALGTIYTYDEYGIPGQISSDRFRYTGQIWLRELGMYHYKARVYSPYLGRFLQTDPIGYADQYNLYAYVGSDPVNAIDPSGMAECTGSHISCEEGGTAPGFSGGSDLYEGSGTRRPRTGAPLDFEGGSGGDPGRGHNSGNTDPLPGEEENGWWPLARRLLGKFGGAITGLLWSDPASAPAPLDQIVLPNNPSILGHIFRDGPGHYPSNTSAARREISSYKT